MFALLGEGTGKCRHLTLTLDEFGVFLIEEEASRYALEPHQFVARAARYFLAARILGRTAHRIPAHRCSETGRVRLQLALRLDEEVWHELEAEAARQKVSIERLLGYSALYLAAEPDPAE